MKIDNQIQIKQEYKNDTLKGEKNDYDSDNDDCDSENDSYGDEDDESDGVKRSSGLIYHEMPLGSRTNYKGHWTKEEVREIVNLKERRLKIFIS